MKPPLVLQAVNRLGAIVNILNAWQVMRSNESLGGLATNSRASGYVVDVQFELIDTPQHLYAGLDWNIKLGAQRLIEIDNNGWLLFQMVLRDVF